MLTHARPTFFASRKPPIELFDLRDDPHEINNVADDPKYATQQENLLDQWKPYVFREPNADVKRPKIVGRK